jgi:serine/threonine-protein kinase
MSLRVVLVDDSMIIRAGLARLLESEGLSVIAEAGDGDTALRAVALHTAEVAIVDIRMPPTHTDEGIRTAQRIRREYPATAVLVLSQYVEATYAVELLAGGSTHVGYLLKDRVLDRSTLLAAVWRVHAGEVVVDPVLVGSLLHGSTTPSTLDKLSERERQVLALMAEGLTDRGIAERLLISPKTIGSHIQHIFDRLGIPDTATDNRRVHAVLAYLQAS